MAKQYNFNKKITPIEEQTIMTEEKQLVSEKPLVAEKLKMPKKEITKLKQSTYIRHAESGRDSQWILPKYAVANVQIEGEEAQVTIRYLKGSKSPILDEQNEMPDDKTEIVFTGGSLHVKGDIALEKYLDLHPRNNSNPNRDIYAEPLFYKLDVEAATNVKLKRFDAMDDAISLFKQMDINDIKSIALSIPYMRSHVKGWEIAELKYAMRTFIEQSPEEFLNANSKPRTKICAILHDANSLNIIDTASSISRITWHGTKNVIVEVPVGFDSVDYMADLVVTGELKVVYQEIKKKVETLYS